MTPIEEATLWVNGTATVAFFVLLGAILFSLVRRLRLYRAARLTVPTLLRMALVLFGALAVIGGEGVVLRVLGITLEERSVERLIFIVQADLILLTAMAYYAKAELFDIDNEERP